jgi:Uma2 family endonuclease
MSTLPKRRSLGSSTDAPRLRHGDRMKQPEFHRRYEAYPEDMKFELIGGVVYMASPLRRRHSSFDGLVGYVLEVYRRATPGTEVLHGATTILGAESEPQPDLGLRVLPEYGGQTRDTEDDYVAGPPELLVEIAHGTRRLDLTRKREDYEQTGVLEYLVVDVERSQLHWFDFRAGRQLVPNSRGIYASVVFPGLWIHRAALLALDSPRVESVLRKGLASRGHAAFVKRLETARRKLAEGSSGA